MANIYWNEKKEKFETVYAELMAKMPEITDYTFTVVKDDGMVVCVSENTGGGNAKTSPYKEGHTDIIPPKYKGWRIIKLIVPVGYISAFYESTEAE